VSQLAQFFVMGRDELRPPFAEAFQATARELDTFDWSGYYFAVLLPYLDEKDVPLMDSEFDAAASAIGEAQEAVSFIFTPAHKAYLEQLRPDVHSEDELRRFFEEFNEYEDPDAGRAMQAALAGLHRHIGDLDDSSVLLLTVG
jgi:hypothetical protein